MTHPLPVGATEGEITPNLACVVLAHTDPVHVRRLVTALSPFPVFLHCDVRTSDAVYADMTTGLPPRCRLLRRVKTGWARWENVAAELDGYAQALALPEVTHVATFTGSDYPLAHSGDLSRFFEKNRGVSFAGFAPLPIPYWGPSGGFSRLRYPHSVFRKRMLRLPVPRRLPRNVSLAGGSQMKVLARPHAQIVIDALRDRPDLAKFWRHSWIPDETFIPSILSTPQLAPGWANERVNQDLWFIKWGDGAQKSPAWLSSDDIGALRDASRGDTEQVPRLFARKFATDRDGQVLDSIDRELRFAGRIWK